MKKPLSCLVLLSLLCVSSGLLQGQTRPRRVNQDSPESIDSPSTARPPVLQGANYPNNRQPSDPPPTPSVPEEVEPGDVIRVNTTLVTLPVSVTDRYGRYVPNLGKEDFQLWEDGVEQKVAFFSSVDKPFSVVLMIDTSGSTRFRLEDIQYAANTFVNQLRPEDRVMVVSFDDDVKVLTDFTSDRTRLGQAIRRTHTGEGTKLYEAVDMVINQRLNRVSGRKAIVLFTDGVDTTSRHATYESTTLDAEELDALIYPVQYDTYFDVNSGGQNPSGSGGGVLGQILGNIILGGPMRRPIGRGSRGNGSSRRDYERASRYLSELSERTGARQYQADSTQNLADAFSKIAEELRRQYSIGYYPTRTPRAGERRQIRVRVDQPNLAVRTRGSYVFNPENIARQENKAPVLRKFSR